MKNIRRSSGAKLTSRKYAGVTEEVLAETRGLQKKLSQRRRDAELLFESFLYYNILLFKFR